MYLERDLSITTPTQLFHPPNLSEVFANFAKSVKRLVLDKICLEMLIHIQHENTQVVEHLPRKDWPFFVLTPH